MIEIFNQIDLTFSDYLLMAIILIFLHLINIIELISMKNRNEEPDRFSNLKFQATFAFIGIISTIICGLIAQYLHGMWIDTALVSFPLLFIVVWFINQPRSSDFIKLTDIHDKIHDIIQQEIASYAQREQEFTLAKLRKDYATIVTVDILIRNFSSYYPKRMKLPLSGFDELFSPLKFTEEDIKGILQNLCSSGDLIPSDNETYRYNKTATEKK